MLLLERSTLQEGDELPVQVTGPIFVIGNDVVSAASVCLEVVQLRGELFAGERRDQAFFAIDAGSRVRRVAGAGAAVDQEPAAVADGGPFGRLRLLEAGARQGWR